MQRAVLVFGSNGALGVDVVRAFAGSNWLVVGVDVAAPRSEVSAYLKDATTLSVDWSIEKMQTAVMDSTKASSFDAVINVAGGWAGGSVADASTAAATELMLRQSVYTSVVAAHVASQRGREGVFLALTGSAASLQGTAGMVGYGMAKAAVHHLVRSIAADPSKLPKGACVVGVLPMTLDTPGNRAGMPGADFSSWTPTTFAGKQLLDWSEGVNRPRSGSLAVWETKEGKTTTTFANGV